jgi:hypothetical protein
MGCIMEDAIDRWPVSRQLRSQISPPELLSFSEPLQQALVATRSPLMIEPIVRREIPMTLWEFLMLGLQTYVSLVLHCLAPL